MSSKYIDTLVYMDTWIFGYSEASWTHERVMDAWEYQSYKVLRLTMEDVLEPGEYLRESVMTFLISC